jgi:hypothetical protein
MHIFLKLKLKSGSNRWLPAAGGPPIRLVQDLGQKNSHTHTKKKKKKILYNYDKFALK